MVKKNRKERRGTLAKSYEPTPHERAALEAYRIQEEESPLAPRLRVTENDGATLGRAAPYARLFTVQLHTHGVINVHAIRVTSMPRARGGPKLTKVRPPRLIQGS